MKTNRLPAPSGKAGHTSWCALAVILLGGLLLRAPWLPTPGYNGMGVWKAWAFGTTQVGIADVYRLRQYPEPPVTWRTVQQALTGALPLTKVGFGDRAFDPDYPPGTFYLLGALATVYRTAVSPAFRDGRALNLTIKLPLLGTELATALLLGWVVRRRWGPRAGLGTLAVYWLNPSVLLGGSILAFLDAFYGLALLAGAVALLRGRPGGLWLGWAVALALKPQPLLLLPAVILLTMHVGPTRLLRYAATAGGFWLTLSLPMLIAGHPLGLLTGVAGNAHEGYVSANQFNLWWLWSYLYARRHGHPHAVMLQQAQLIDPGTPHLQLWGWAFFALWTLFLGLVWWAAARRQPGGGASGTQAILLLGLQLYGGVMLLTSMHENHLLGALPLLALAAGWAGPRHAGGWLAAALYGGVSVVAGANLLMVFGLGVGAASPLPRMWGTLDGSLVLTGLNLLLFGLGGAGWAWRCRAGRPLVPAWPWESTSAAAVPTS